MKTLGTDLSRRQFCAALATASSGFSLATGAAAARDELKREDLAGKALVAITLDLEMSRNFPTWEQTHWDYEKGNLDADTKRYTTEFAKRLKDHGGVLHCFAVGRTLEQEDVGWL